MDQASDDSTVLPEVRKGEEKGEEQQEVKVVSLSENFTTGMVETWKRSHGFISYKAGEEESKKIFVHRSNVKTNDREANLRRGMTCQFKIQETSDGKINAVEVSAVGGGPLNFHEKHGETDKYDREDGQYEGAYYTGSIAFYSRKRGYGRIAMDESTKEQLTKFNAPLEEMGNLYFKGVDLEVKDYPAKVMRKDAVRFKIFSSSRGHGAYAIQLASGEPFPQFTMEEREERRKAAEERAREEEEKKAEREEKDKAGKATKKKRRRRRGKKGEAGAEPSAEPKVERTFEAVDKTARHKGVVVAFSVHRFGFLKPEDPESLRPFGIIKNKKLAFFVQEIHTDARPALISVQYPVTFSIGRYEDNVLFATDIRDKDNGKVVCDRVYKQPKPRTLADEQFYEGTVAFYNWRRGHGRVELKGDAENRFYFHRDDLRSQDKVPGIVEGTAVVCQKVDDPKGPAVTNIMNPDKTPFAGHYPAFYTKSVGMDSSAQGMDTSAQGMDTSAQTSI